ncbi:DUF2254 domain-containing protein [Brachybacterium sp. EF45031]|uniref:DUF2254 domain-containing protein n=1 Tax=Brachybacterium sillae TaxID=2810536 RepID=UPI00217DE291|nr:DUF2254 domain-containing protein [Brachybacterium sillae]MCS6712002.1 DUF2254 domain-containing protein [Brachybacterium sillae]
MSSEVLTPLPGPPEQPGRFPVVAEPHRIHRASLLRRMLRPFWVVPALITLAALLLGLTLPLADGLFDHRIGIAFRGGPEGARSVLGTVASAMPPSRDWSSRSPWW